MDTVVIRAAIDKYREKCPESYPDATDTELIVNVLESAGLFGSMAAKEHQRAEKAAARFAAYKELKGAMNFVLAFYEPGQRYLDTNAWTRAEASARRALAKAKEFDATLEPVSDPVLTI